MSYEYSLLLKIEGFTYRENAEILSFLGKDETENKDTGGSLLGLATISPPAYTSFGVPFIWSS